MAFAGIDIAPRRFGAIVPVVLALVVAAGIYAFGRSHTPDYSGTALFGRSAQDTLPLKSLLGTVVLGLALSQLGSATWMYGGLGRLPVPRRLPLLHRVTGLAALLVTLPIGYHCMFAYGVQTADARVAVHSLAGCFFYGAFAAKVTIVRSRRLPGWMLPVAGGMLVLLVGALWYTSALWYYDGYSLPLP